MGRRIFDSREIPCRPRSSFRPGGKSLLRVYAFSGIATGLGAGVYAREILRLDARCGNSEEVAFIA